MQRPRKAFLAVVAASLLAAPGSAWDRTGHLVVAQIAWGELGPAARSAAAQLLAAAPEDADLRQLRPENLPLADRQRLHFQIAAYWPDLMRDGDFPKRRDQYHHGDWHWINHFFEQTGPDGASREMTELEPRGLLVERLGTLVKELGEASRPAPERAIRLAWVLHLGGDIHQPLHATARVTPTEPQGDRGGNLFELNGRNNLHSLWDGILRSSNSRWLFQGENSYVAGIARSIAEEHPPSDFGDQIGNRDFGSWARASFELSMAALYPAELERGRRPPRGYARQAEILARERIALAGYRLASILEQALGGTP